MNLVLIFSFFDSLLPTEYCSHIHNKIYLTRIFSIQIVNGLNHVTFPIPISDSAWVMAGSLLLRQVTSSELTKSAYLWVANLLPCFKELLPQLT